MHPETLAIRALWDVDREMEALRAEAGDLAHAVEEARKALAAAVARRDGTLASLEDVVGRERKLNRQLEEYLERRDRTKTLIDEGRAGDFISAQRQYEQCAGIVDETEMALLETMEEREQVEARLAGDEESVARREAALGRAGAHQSERRPQVVERYRALEPLREERLAEVPVQLHGRYKELRRRGLAAVTWIRDGACEECHMTVPNQVAIEVVQGKRVHNCRGCGRFLMDVREQEPEP